MTTARSLAVALSVAALGTAPSVAAGAEIGGTIVPAGGVGWAGAGELWLIPTRGGRVVRLAPPLSTRSLPSVPSIRRLGNGRLRAYATKCNVSVTSCRTYRASLPGGRWRALTPPPSPWLDMAVSVAGDWRVVARRLPRFGAGEIAVFENGYPRASFDGSPSEYRPARHTPDA